jgi:predicted GNAT family N-acyltransferase
MPELSIQKINTQHPLYPAVFLLREEVLRKPLGLSLYHEDTSADDQDDILLALIDQQVIACLMLQYIDQQTVKFRQMAVAEAYRSKHIGQQLIYFAEAALTEAGYKKIQLHARMSALGFYEKLGYQAYGAEFEEVTIPHIAMQKSL